MGTALGDRLPAAAAMNRMSTTELRDLLESDSTAWVGKDGRIFYVDRAEAMVFDVAEKRISESLVKLFDSVTETVDQLEHMYGDEG
mgnify:CR=1 FL=1